MSVISAVKDRHPRLLKEIEGRYFDDLSPTPATQWANMDKPNHCILQLTIHNHYVAMHRFQFQLWIPFITSITPWPLPAFFPNLNHNPILHKMGQDYIDKRDAENTKLNKLSKTELANY